MYKNQNWMPRTIVRGALDRRQVVRGTSGLAAGMRLRHSHLPALLRHALATLTLSRSHRHRRQGAGHDRSRKQEQRQQRNPDFANRFHKPQKIIGSTAGETQCRGQGCRLLSAIAQPILVEQLPLGMALGRLLTALLPSIFRRLARLGGNQLAFLIFNGLQVKFSENSVTPIQFLPFQPQIYTSWAMPWYV